MSYDVIDLKTLPSIWYYGTHHIRTEGIIERGIDLSKSRARLDFGPGFYLTSNFEQAKRRALAVTMDFNKEQNKNFINHGTPAGLTFGTVIVYELDVAFMASHMKGLLFNRTDMDWGEFILGNRSIKAEEFGYNDHNRDGRYDWVYGPLADGLKIPKLIRDLEKERINKETFLIKITEAFEFPYNNQLSLHSENTLGFLIYKEVLQVGEQQTLDSRR